MDITSRNKTMRITRFGEFWEVSTFWDTGIRNMHLSTVHVYEVANLLACVARVSDRDDYRVRVLPIEAESAR